MIQALATSLTVLLAIRVPIAFAIAGSSLLFFLTQKTYPREIFAQQLVSGINSFPFLAVPFFILAGNLMNEGGMTRRLIDFSQALAGHLTGGLAQVNVIVGLLFGGMSGSATADASFEAKILVPQMTARGYPTGFSAALTVSTAVISALLPPSIGFVIYGFITNTSIARLFLAGFIPALVTTMVFMIMVYFMAKHYGFERGNRKKFSLTAVWKTGVGAIWAILLPIIIVGGIRFGVFTPTEAAAVAGIYALIIGLVVVREIKPGRLPHLFAETARETAAVSLILAVASPFAWILTVERIPHHASEALIAISTNPFIILFIINIFLLVIGTLLDPGPMMIIIVPILFPIVTQLGVDPVHFGVIMIFNLLLAAISPPEGGILFAVIGVLDISMGELTRWLIPQFLVLLFLLFLFTFVPALSLTLPNLVMGVAR